MSTNKLGLQFSHTNGGLRFGMEKVNVDEWYDKITDLRDELKSIQNLNADNYVLRLRCLDKGYLLTIASPIPGRVTDYRSAWIFVPCDLQIDGKRLADIIEMTRKEVMAKTANSELLENKFNKTYESSPAKRITAETSGDKSAYRYYGSGTTYQLWEILDNLYQPYYQQYNSVFLIEKSTGITCSHRDNLSGKPLVKSILANAPKDIDGFSPYLNGKEFSSPIYVTEGESLEITWKKNGYAPIPTTSKVENGSVVYKEPTRNLWRREIPFESVMVIDENNRPITEYSFTINGKEVSVGKSFVVSEDALSRVKLSVRADGYDPCEESVDFAKNKQVSVKLSKTKYTYKLVFPKKNSNEYNQWELTIDTPLEESPIEGYVVTGGQFSNTNQNYMRYKPFKRFWIYVIIGAFLFIGGGALGALGWHKLNTSKGANATDMRETIQKLEHENDSLRRHIKLQKKRREKDAPDITAIIDYLDKNNVWDKNKMENFPQLKGLWDALNTRNFKEILSFEEKLQRSNRFKKIVEAVKRNQNKSFQSNNCRDNDNKITIENDGNNKGYIKALDDAERPSENPTTNSTTRTAEDQTRGQAAWS